MVQGVVSVDSELQVHRFAHWPLLLQRGIEIDESRSYYRVARIVSEGEGRRSREHRGVEPLERVPRTIVRAAGKVWALEVIAVDQPDVRWIV